MKKDCSDLIGGWLETHESDEHRGFTAIQIRLSPDGLIQHRLNLHITQTNLKPFQPAEASRPQKGRSSTFKGHEGGNLHFHPRQHQNYRKKRFHRCVWSRVRMSPPPSCYCRDFIFTPRTTGGSILPFTGWWGFILLIYLSACRSPVSSSHFWRSRVITLKQSDCSYERFIIIQVMKLLH